jgi:hypothetical protein
LQISSFTSLFIITGDIKQTIERRKNMTKGLMTNEELQNQYNRKYLDQPVGTDEVINRNDIIIPRAFKQTRYRMNQEKIRKAIRYYIDCKMLDKPITVIVETNEKKRHNKFILVDEYSRYIAAVDWIGLNYIPVKYIDIDTYCKERRY